jgi:hypothetical protein
MAVLLKEIFNEASKHIKFDQKLAKKIHTYVAGLMNRNEDHVMFFGSNLTGLYPLRFKTGDRNEWFVDIKDIDGFAIKKRVREESIIDESWERATDVFNLDTLYTVHRFLNAPLSEREKQKAIHDTLMALNIKLMGSIMARYFPYPCDEAVALEVYSRLSKKFHIKKYGNWRGVLENRADDIVSVGSKWLPVLKDFNDDAELAQCISDIQGRLRSMIKYIWDVLEKVKLDQAKFNRTSMSIDAGGEKVLQELKRDSDSYKDYAHKVVLDEHTFIKPELVTIIDAEMKTMPVKLMVDCLKHMCLLANNDDKLLDQLLDDIIEHAINTIRDDRSAGRNMHDLSWILRKEKLLITAPKTTSELVFSMRDKTEVIVRKAAKTKNATIIAAIKTGICLYVIGRTFAMKHYD